MARSGGSTLDELHLDGLKIDSLVDLLRASFFLEEWKRMLEISDKLLLSANKIYSRQKDSLKAGKRYAYDDRERHIVYYFGFSYMSKGIALHKMERFEESKEYIKKYVDLSWLDDGSKKAKEEIDFFKLFARGNSYIVCLLEGNLEVLDSYVQFLKESRPEELFPGLITILEAALKHDFNVDKILQSFKADVLDTIYYYESQNRKTRYLTIYYYMLSLYKIKTRHYQDAIYNILQALVASDSFKDIVTFKKSVALFEAYRDYASDEQKERYKLKMNDLLKEELRSEKIYYIDDDHIGVI
jgi:tetratricopeptide (TPR) repeat protein